MKTIDQLLVWWITTTGIGLSLMGVLANDLTTSHTMSLIGLILTITGIIYHLKTNSK
jgi:hypothetical protein